MLIDENDDYVITHVLTYRLIYMCHDAERCALFS